MFMTPPDGARGAATVIGLTTLLAVLSGCASVAPTSTLPDISQRSGVAQQLTPAAAAAGLQLGVPSRNWWQDLADPRLNTLMDLAMAGNHERLAALAAVKEARAMAGLAERASLPQGSFGAQVQRTQASIAEVDAYQQGLARPPEQSLATVGQTVSWELDLFGRIGTATAVAERQADAARAEAHAATALLQAEVVRQYVRLRLHQQELEQLKQEVTVLGQRQTRMQSRVQAGLADQREALSVAAELAQVRAQQAQAQALVHVSVAALATLAGRAPTQTDAKWQTLMAAAQLPTVPTSAGLVQPNDLLANRPDVARADALLRASLGNVVLAERAHLPRLSLNLNVGANALAGNLGSAGALRYAAGPVLQWDWLDMGRIQAQAAAAQAGSERAWHGLEQTVLKALEDSESALRGWVATQQQLQRAQQSEQAARATAQYTGVRARSGLEPSSLALDHQVQQLRAQRNTLAAQAAAIESFTQVQLALGAWQPQAAATP